MSCDEGCGCDHKQEEEIEVEAEGIEVSSQPIELYKVLKIANVVEGGGQAKVLIADGYVYVNGEVELRKRRKCYDGDVIYFNEEYYVVLCDTPAPTPTPRLPESEWKPVKETKKDVLNRQRTEAKAQALAENPVDEHAPKTARKAIKF